MKKALSTALAILLTLGMLLAFAACNDKPDDPTSEPSSETTANEEPTAPVVNPDPTTPVITEPDITTVVTTEATTTTEEAKKDPTTMSKAELLDYFNTAVNNVRSQKPQFDYVIIRKMDQVDTTILGGMVDGIVNSVVKSLMPGTPETGTVQKGSGNKGKFLSSSENKASLLTSGQISSITATKQGDGFSITVQLPTSTDPSKTAGNSAYANLHEINDSAGIVKEIVGNNGAIKADPALCTLVYKDGYATITVNAAGQVTAMEGGFKVDANGKDWSVIGLKGDVVAKQSTVVKALNFIW